MDDLVLSKCHVQLREGNFAAFQEARRAFVYLCALCGESPLSSSQRARSGTKGRIFSNIIVLPYCILEAFRYTYCHAFQLRLLFLLF